MFNDGLFVKGTKGSGNTVGLTPEERAICYENGVVDRSKVVKKLNGIQGEMERVDRDRKKAIAALDKKTERDYMKSKGGTNSKEVRHVNKTYKDGMAKINREHREKMRSLRKEWKPVNHLDVKLSKAGYKGKTQTAHPNEVRAQQKQKVPKRMNHSQVFGKSQTTTTAKSSGSRKTGGTGSKAIQGNKKVNLTKTKTPQKSIVSTNNAPKKSTTVKSGGTRIRKSKAPQGQMSLPGIG